MSMNTVCTPTPSVNRQAELNSKNGIAGDVSNAMSNGNVECTFMRGGKCNQHGVVGIKSTITKKVWAKKRDGTFAFQYKKAVKYDCKIGKCNPVTTSETSEHDQLGGSQCGMGDDSESGNSGIPDRISGVGIRKGAANYGSESGMDYESRIVRVTGPTD